MLKCQQCGIDAYLGFTCSQCGNYYCAKDRLPEKHHCSHLDSKRDEIQFQAQLETPAVHRPDKNADMTASKWRGSSKEGSLPGDLADEEENNKRFAVGPSMNMFMFMLIFVLFAAFDVISLVIAPSIWTALPLFVHGVFLPILTYIAYKQRKGDYPPSSMITFVKLLITYMVIYLAVGITIAIVFGNIFSVAIDLFIGICMVIMWRRVLQQMRYMF